MLECGTEKVQELNTKKLKNNKVAGGLFLATSRNPP